MPTEAIEAPASVSAPGVVAPGISGNRHDAVATASTSGIPSAALAAYQRAETVINAADKSCRLPWQLVAAIGRVESDHGRTNGNRLDDKGVARPGIYGPALNGRNNTSSIKDTDAGQLDADAKYDRAVGPMQFIPSTWSVVGVDADGDAQRNPQDVDDAALATAVYLCSGADDLSGTPGQRAAVYRYNHSKSYVDLVLSIMNAYLDGDFTSVPNSTTSAGYLVPAPSGNKTRAGPRTDRRAVPAVQRRPGARGPAPRRRRRPRGAATPAPRRPRRPAPPRTPAPAPTKAPAPVPTKLPLPSPTSNPVDEVLTKAQAIIQCTKEGYDPVLEKAAFDQCVARYTS